MTHSIEINVGSNKISYLHSSFLDRRKALEHELHLPKSQLCHSHGMDCTTEGKVDPKNNFHYIKIIKTHDVRH